MAIFMIVLVVVLFVVRFLGLEMAGAMDQVHFLAAISLASTTMTEIVM